MGEAELRHQVEQLLKTMAEIRNQRDDAKRQLREIQRAQAERAATAHGSENGLGYRIGPRGGIVLDGLRSPMHPVTLYKRELVRLLAAKAAIEEFISQNDAFLSQGPDDPRFPKVAAPARRTVKRKRRS